MDKETEIKLRVSPAAITSLREHPLLNRRRTGEWHTGTLYNQYYDTAERDLALARVALRVRRDGEQYIQTLKSKGQSVAGLSERNEWDWPIDGPGLDLTLLDDSCWPASLATLDKPVQKLWTELAGRYQLIGNMAFKLLKLVAALDKFANPICPSV